MILEQKIEHHMNLLNAQADILKWFHTLSKSHMIAKYGQPTHHIMTVLAKNIRQGKPEEEWCDRPNVKYKTVILANGEDCFFVHFRDMVIYSGTTEQLSAWSTANNRHYGQVKILRDLGVNVNTHE
jgi:hypothetical protein